MAKIHKLMVGESLVGDGNEVAHIDLIIGPRGSAAESAFAALSNSANGSLAIAVSDTASNLTNAVFVALGADARVASIAVSSGT